MHMNCAELNLIELAWTDLNKSTQLHDAFTGDRLATAKLRRLVVGYCAPALGGILE